MFCFDISIKIVDKATQTKQTYTDLQNKDVFFSPKVKFTLPSFCILLPYVPSEKST